MRLQKAIQTRILQLCQERKWSVNKLAERSGISPSTLRRTVKPYASINNTTTGLILKICQGLEIPFKDFWDSPLFEDLEEEP
ncbi:MAG: helix-turn-helix transcriptional regulator [Faecalibacterium sp.]|jgi:transcriptional regulator with XRE-family HTH domain|nr:helix-turn-helix transcriptional regulator [Faecalibacterium sp.]